LNPLLIVAQRPLRKLQRLLLHGKVVDGVDEIPVRISDVAARLDGRRLELDVGVLAQLPDPRPGRRAPA
jgi:hypothetical protein